MMQAVDEKLLLWNKQESSDGHQSFPFLMMVIWDPVEL